MFLTGECCCGLLGPHATASQCLQAHTSHKPASCSQQSTTAILGQDIFQVCVRAVGALPERHCSEGVWLGGCDRPAGPLLSACPGLHCRSALHLPLFHVSCMAGSLLQAWLQRARLLCDDRSAWNRSIIDCFQIISWRCLCAYLQALPINIFGLCSKCCYSFGQQEFDQSTHGMTWLMFLCQAVSCHCSAAGTVAL